MWLALYKKELGGFFYNRSAYFILTIYLFLSLLTAVFLGYYFVVDNSSMRSYFAFQPHILLMIIPAITMKLWAEENKNGTLEILLTFPIDDWTLVSTKFAATWSLSGLMLLMSVPLAVSTAVVIDTDNLNIVSDYCGAFLAAGVLTALGCWVSCLNNIPAAAYLISVLLGWGIVALNLNSVLAPIIYKMPNPPLFLPDAFNFSERYMSFLNGFVTPDTFFYFISFISLLLFFNYLAVKAKRSEK